MFYREAGDFSTTYAQDNQTFPIKFDRYRYYVVLFIAIVVVPFLINDYWVNSLLLPFLIYAIAAIGLNILVGYCGQVSLGTGGFMGGGALSFFKVDWKSTRMETRQTGRSYVAFWFVKKKKTNTTYIRCVLHN